MKKKFIMTFITILTLSCASLSGCTIEKVAVDTESETQQSETEEKKDKDKDKDKEKDRDKDKDKDKKKDTETETEEELTAASVEERLAEQPVVVLSTQYYVQDEKYKYLYPDLLGAVIQNNTTQSLKKAVVAYVAWDSNNMPVKIETQYDYSGGDYVVECNIDDLNLVSGGTYGENMGMALDPDCSTIATFKVIVVSCEDFSGNKWENPVYDDWKSVYENKVLE